jgi:predicted RNA-binding Zn ribbon-like protein
VNLTSYAELAVRLVNTAFQANDDPDPLGAIDAFGVLVADHPHLARAVTPLDLDALRALRDELGEVFTAAATGREDSAVQRLNALLVRSPIQPELVSHDDQHWHLHLADAGSGSAFDRYASGAMIGLTLVVSQLGIKRLGVCSIASCHRVFIDASSNRSRRYCTEHCATRANVTTIRARLTTSGTARLTTSGTARLTTSGTGPAVTAAG